LHRTAGGSKTRSTTYAFIRLRMKDWKQVVAKPGNDACVFAKTHNAAIKKHRIGVYICHSVSTGYLNGITSSFCDRLGHHLDVEPNFQIQNHLTSPLNFHWFVEFTLGVAGRKENRNMETTGHKSSR